MAIVVVVELVAMQWLMAEAGWFDSKMPLVKCALFCVHACVKVCSASDS